MQNTQYIGDGVYVGTDCGSVVLRTGAHEVPDNVIYLEPEVWDNLQRWHNNLTAQPSNGGGDS